MGCPTSRRSFLGLAGATVTTGAVVGACSPPTSSVVREAQEAGILHPFRGAHQVGVTAPSAAVGLTVGLDVRSSDRAGLADMMRSLSDAIEHAMDARPYEARAGGFPPLDTGILGPTPGANGINAVVGFGASLFDERFGLAGLRPSELRRMPTFSNDQLIRAATSHGDVSVTINAANADALAHTFRQLLRATRGQLVPRWSKEGYNHLIPGTGAGEAPVRNLMGFKDGTANPAGDDVDLMDELVWVDTTDGEPEWTVGGTYQAVRIIRMQVEFWDRTRLNEQEAIFGRKRDSGAPLGGDAETDDPADHDFDLTSHIGRANPRTPGTTRILRRGFSYSSGFDTNDQLDQGLIFVSYQRSLDAGFVATQRRLDGEALEEYIRPIHGGFFYVPPAPADGEYLGQRLLES